MKASRWTKRDWEPTGTKYERQVMDGMGAVLCEHEELGDHKVEQAGPVDLQVHFVVFAGHFEEVECDLDGSISYLLSFK
jgi:hypothetical protein